MNEISHKQAYDFIHMGESHLDTAQREGLASHLSSCLECEEYARVQQQLAGLMEHAMHARWDGNHPEKFTQEKIVAVARKSIRFHSAFSFARTLLLVAVLIAILVSGVYFLLPGNIFRQSKPNEIPAKPNTNDMPIVDFPSVSTTPTQSQESELEKLAVDTALAYFTFDYSDVVSWWSSVEDQAYWDEFIKKEVGPVLIPFMEENEVISKATLASSEKIFYKKWDNGDEETIWKLNLFVTPPWPGEKPPYPFGQGASNIPWTDGEKTVVYVAAINYDGNTEVLLIPVDSIDEALQSLQDSIEANKEISEIDGMTLIYIPAGEFLMGSAYASPEAKADEQPQHPVFLNSYWIDKTEVTNAMYVRFLNETERKVGAMAFDDQKVQFHLSDQGWVVDDGKENYPAVYVTWFGAQEYCESAGRRLPTEAEWEKTARGDNPIIYPWGDTSPDCTKAQFDSCGGHTIEVGNLGEGQSAYGVMDLAGNVWEWVSDWYDDTYYTRHVYFNPQGPDRSYYELELNKPLGGAVIRGGSWVDEAANLRTANRAFQLKEESSAIIGFRCAMSMDSIQQEKTAVPSSPLQTQEDQLEKLAVDTALAYFTFDYRDVNSWGSSVQDQAYWEEFIKEEVSPILIPFLEENRVISKASLVSIERKFYNQWSNGEKQIIWKLNLSVAPPWPGGKPPTPFGQGVTNIPWTDGENSIVYAQVMTYADHTDIFLIPAGSIAIQSLE